MRCMLEQGLTTQTLLIMLAGYSGTGSLYDTWDLSHVESGSASNQELLVQKHATFESTDISSFFDAQHQPMKARHFFESIAHVHFELQLSQRNLQALTNNPSSANLVPSSTSSANNSYLRPSSSVPLNLFLGITTSHFVEAQSSSKQQISLIV